jgi:hypothetical protein
VRCRARINSPRTSSRVIEAQPLSVEEPHDQLHVYGALGEAVRERGHRRQRPASFARLAEVTDPVVARSAGRPASGDEHRQPCTGWVDCPHTPQNGPSAGRLNIAQSGVTQRKAGVSAAGRGGAGFGVTTVEPAYVVGPTVGVTPADNAPAMTEVFSPIRKNNASPSVNTRASSRHKKVTSGTRKSDRTAPAPPRDGPKIGNSSPNRSVKATSNAYMTLRNLSVRKMWN